MAMNRIKMSENRIEFEIEEKMNPNSKSRIPEFLSALDIMREVHIKKNQDYASDNNPFSNFDVADYLTNQFNRNRDKVFVNPIATKLARLATLLNKTSKPNNESIEDSLIDIANYILLWRADIIQNKTNERRKEFLDIVEESQTEDKDYRLTNNHPSHCINCGKLITIRYSNYYCSESCSILAKKFFNTLTPKQSDKYYGLKYCNHLNKNGIRCFDVLGHTGDHVFG